MLAIWNDKYHKATELALSKGQILSSSIKNKSRVWKTKGRCYLKISVVVPQKVRNRSIT